MARPRTFDENDVLLKALDVFKAKGFKATSLAELLTATQLSRSSFYSCFGSKRQLFMRAFEANRQARLSRLAHFLDGTPDVRQGVKDFFQALLEPPQATSAQCLSCTESAALAPHDDVMRSMLERDRKGLEDKLTAALERGQANHTINQAAPARSLAQALLVLYQGVQVMRRTGMALPVLREAVVVSLAILAP
ncbi:TetR/AcrR family transcriptional regulator [Formicincola oecophyllae]|uniref:TetR/AcrR family transcriptional regulator n=1 Tax=Formicincola oecophyllae TaxID=2558361 RepID=UPI00143D4061|nr:TetR/AcrR family transcriptional regulator [Formicincola oecophyllae]